MLTVPDWKEKNKIEVIQFSKHDSVKALYSRLIDPADSESKILWRIGKQKGAIREIVNNVKTVYQKHKQIKIGQKERIYPSDDSVMLLNLDVHSILVIENNPIKNESISPNNVHVEFKNSQNNFDINSVNGRSKEDEKRQESNQNSSEGNKLVSDGNQNMRKNTKSKDEGFTTHEVDNKNSNLNRESTKNETQNGNQLNKEVVVSSNEKKEIKQLTNSCSNNSSNQNKVRIIIF